MLSIPQGMGWPDSPLNKAGYGQNINGAKGQEANSRSYAVVCIETLETRISHFFPITNCFLTSSADSEKHPHQETHQSMTLGRPDDFIWKKHRWAPPNDGAVSSCTHTRLHASLFLLVHHGKCAGRGSPSSSQK